MSSQQWYVKVGDRTVGPLSTDRVLRGLADGEFSSSALVCRAGAYSWLPLAAVPTFAKGSTRPPAESGSALGSVEPGSGRAARPQVRDAYQAVQKPGGLRAAAASASQTLQGSVAEAATASGVLPDTEELAEGHGCEDSLADRVSTAAADSARGLPDAARSESGGGTPIGTDARAQECGSARIRPMFTLSVSPHDAPPGPGMGQGVAEMREPEVPDIDEKDFREVLDISSPGADQGQEPAVQVAPLRSVVLDSGPAGQPRDRDSSIVVTAQVVLSERVRPAGLNPIGVAAAPTPSGDASGPVTASLVDRIEAGAWRLEQVPGPSVSAGQTVVIRPMQAQVPADPAQTQRLQAQEPPATLRDNPFMSQRPVEPEPSAPTRTNGALPTGRNGSLPVSQTPETMGGSEIECSAKAFDWSQQFCGYFQMGESFELPDQRVLLRSLQLVSLDVLVQPEAMWNLAVCLALGSDPLATAAANAFFHIMTVYPNRDRLEWMARVLLSRGFLPSGIPLAAGERAVRLLQASCPPELRPSLCEALAE